MSTSCATVGLLLALGAAALAHMQPLSNDAALLALQSGEVDAAIFVDGAENHAVWTALHDPTLKLLSYSKVDAYHRRLSFVTKLTLPPGVIDLAKNIPDTGRAGRHHIDPFGCSSVSALPLSSTVASLARPVAGLSMVRRAGSTRARCHRAHGHIRHIANGEVAG